MQRGDRRRESALPARQRGARRSDPRTLPTDSGCPELVVIGEHLQRFVVARWFDPRKNSAKDCIEDRRSVPHKKMDGIEPVTQVKLGIVIQGAAVKPFESVRDPPAYQVAERVVVQMEPKRDRIIEE